MRLKIAGGYWLLSASLVGLSCSGTHGEFDYEDVEPIFASKCIRCHSEPLSRFDAPFELGTYEQVYKQRDAIEIAVRTGNMPLPLFAAMPPVEDLSEDEKETLLTWLEDGAPE